MAIFYRALNQHDPYFRAGQLYKYLGKSRADGYIFLEVDGNPRSVWEHQFELVGDRDEKDPEREPDLPPPLGEEFTWRGEQLTAVAAGAIWVINRRGNIMVGPPVIRGEHWSVAADRIREWLDVNVAE